MRRPRPRWAARRRAGCARTRSSSAAHVGVLRGEQGGLRVFDDTSPLVEGLSIDEAFLDVRGLERISGTPAEIAARLRRDGARAGRAADHGRRREHEVPREGGERRRQARRPARRAARRRARLPAPAAGRAALGRRAGDGGEAPRARDHDGRRGRRARRGGARRRCSAARRAGTCTRSPTTATRGRVQVGRRRRSIGSQRALGRVADVAAEVDAALVALVDRVTRRHARRRPRRPHGRAAPALRRLLARDALAHAAAARPRTRRRSSPRRAGCSRPRCR